MTKSRKPSTNYSLSCQCDDSLHAFLITFAAICLHIKLLQLFISQEQQRSEFPTDHYSPPWPEQTDKGRRLGVKSYHPEGIRCWYDRCENTGEY